MKISQQSGAKMRVPATDILPSMLQRRRIGQGPALVLIHGLGSSSRDWEPQINAFSKHYTIIAPDLRGHGRSPPAGKRVRVSALAADVAALLTREGIEHADVVGLSLGGAVAFQLALDHPKRLRSLTIVNSDPEFVARTWRQRLMVMQRLAVTRLLSMKRIGKLLSRRLFPDDAVQRARFIERFAENDRQNYRRTLKGLIGWSVTERLGRITCPMLVVSADRDYTPVATRQAWVDRMPNAMLTVIPDSHHAVTAERPEAFNQALSDFLSSLPAPGAASGDRVAGAEV